MIRQRRTMERVHTRKRKNANKFNKVMHVNPFPLATRRSVARRSSLVNLWFSHGEDTRKGTQIWKNTFFGLSKFDSLRACSRDINSKLNLHSTSRSTHHRSIAD